MSDIFKSLLIAMSIGLIVFCIVIIFDRNSESIEWNKRAAQVREEAERTSENVDRYVKKGKRVYTKLKEMEDEDIGAHPAEPKITPPPAPHPATTTPTPKPVLMNIPTVAAGNTSGFQVQVGRLSTASPNLSSFSAVQHLGSLRIEPAGADKRVMLGTYTSRPEADRILAEVRRLGFSDAFIAAAPQPAATVTVANTKPNTNTATGTLYVVQVVANKYPVGSDYKSLANLGGLYQEKNPDLTKIMLGVFKDEAAARNALQTVKDQGFGGAFIKTANWSTVNSWQKIN